MIRSTVILVALLVFELAGCGEPPADDVATSEVGTGTVGSPGGGTMTSEDTETTDEGNEADESNETDEGNEADESNETDGEALLPGSGGTGFDISAISGPTTEAGGTATFTIKLKVAPTSEVTIAISSSDATEGSVSPASMIFTTSDWSTPQTVTITGVDDTTADTAVGYSVVLAPAVSDDTRYATLNPEDVEVINSDDEPTGLHLVLTTGTSYVMASGYTKVKVWAIGAGGGGASDAAGGGGGAGGVAYKTWTGMGDGTSIAFALGAAGAGSAAGDVGGAGGATTVTIDGLTITGNGGGGGTLDTSNAAGGTFNGGDGGAIGGIGFGVTNQDQGGGGGGGIGAVAGGGVVSGGDGGGFGGAFAEVSDLSISLLDQGYDLTAGGLGGDGSDSSAGFGGDATGFGCGGGGAGWYGGPGGNGLFGGGGGGGASEGTIGTGGDGGAGAVVIYMFN